MNSSETAPTPHGSYRDLFLVSFLILFFELACIRWFGSTVVYLTFFTNLVLMACFLGMSVGCLAASRRFSLIAAVLPLTLVATWTANDVLARFQAKQFSVDVGHQQSPQLIYFGTERSSLDASASAIPIEFIAGTFFLLIALIFVGLGQTLGRTFDTLPDRVRAYTVNVLGSLAGILAFGALSYAQLSPVAWFGISGVICLFFLRGRHTIMAIGLGCLVATLFIVGYTATGPSNEQRVYWSPYYKITATSGGLIETNNIGHQQMIQVGGAGGAYVLPYAMSRAADSRPIKDVLIIGAGSGNDVQAALMSGAEHVDAVEIDPVINRIGRESHPDRPFDDPRVTVLINDGRNVLHRTGKQYDLVVYALVDSLVLHSGYSSIRLESYLFTEQALRDVKARLKPGGTFVMYNYFRQGWAVGRLARMAEDVFGIKPVVVFLPYRETIQPADSSPGFTVLLTGDTRFPDAVILKVREAFERQGLFWLNGVPGLGGAYGPEPPDNKHDWHKIGPAQVTTTGIGPVPTDDWPFLYLREPRIPGLILRGMAIVAVLSLVVLLALTPWRRAVRPDGAMFFLGAGFMLLETKGVVHMALLFGSTWMVNSIVFGAILMMILASNLYVLAARPRRLEPYYVLLALGLLANILVPLDMLLGLSALARVVVSCVLVFAPVAFAGVIFATLFRDSSRPDVALGSNIAGVILGGLSENLSLVLGFNHLLLVALAFYALSYVLRSRTGVSSATGAAVRT